MIKNWKLVYVYPHLCFNWDIFGKLTYVLDMREGNSDLLLLYDLFIQYRLRTFCVLLANTDVSLASWSPSPVGQTENSYMIINHQWARRYEDRCKIPQDPQKGNCISSGRS